MSNSNIQEITSKIRSIADNVIEKDPSVEEFYKTHKIVDSDKLTIKSWFSLATCVVYVNWAKDKFSNYKEMAQFCLNIMSHIEDATDTYFGGIAHAVLTTFFTNHYEPWVKFVIKELNNN